MRLNLRYLLVPLLFLAFNFSSHADDAVILEQAWISEAPPTVKVMAAYLTIVNSSDKDMTLLNVDSQQFERVEIHRSIVENDTVSMQKQNQLIIAAGNRLELKPGDFHLMLFNPKTRLQRGDQHSLRFYFADGSVFETNAVVKRKNLQDHSHHHH